MIFTLAIALVLAQEPAAEPAPVAPSPAPAGSSDVLSPQPNIDALQRQMQRMKRMTPEEAAKAAADLSKKFGGLAPEDFRGRPTPAAPNPIIPEVRDYQQLPEAEQVKYSAREFFTQLIAGDARNITNICGLPFQLEERRLQTSDELFQEWLRNLRAKRTDLLTLYDIEVLTPADMEKKYGKPPRRLEALPWRGNKTYVAVANLSGHATIAVFKYTGLMWAVVGYAD